MIYSELTKVEDVAIIRPEQMRGLSEAEFEQLTDLVNHYLKNHETMRGFVIASERFPSQENFLAFISHIRFFRNHLRAIQKVALVSDSRLLSATPYLVDHFVNAEVRNFTFSDIEYAKMWIVSEAQKKCVPVDSNVR